jgi:SAM-dependent methyltransferase
MKTGMLQSDYLVYKDKQISRSTKKWQKTNEAVESFTKQFRGDWEKVKDIVKCDSVGCMGIKNGAEYKEFKKYIPNSKIYGVDIVPKVAEVGSNCFCHDFSELPEDWQEKFDLLYSNSLDHAFDIDKTINEWHRVTKVGGHLLLVLSCADNIGDVDIYKFEKEDMPVLFDKNKFKLVKMWDHTYEFCVLLEKL